MLLNYLWGSTHYICLQICAIRQLGACFGIQNFNVTCSTRQLSVLVLYSSFEGITCVILTSPKRKLLVITKIWALSNYEFYHSKHFKTFDLKSSMWKPFGQCFVTKQLSSAIASY